MRKLIIFGTSKVSELAWFYFSNDSDYEVVAFSETKEYLQENKSYHDLPVLPFENIERYYPPNIYDFFVPIGHKNMNKTREKVFTLAKDKGYTCATYINSNAKVYHRDCIGENCFILEGSIVQPFVRIGNNTFVWNSHIGHHTIIGDHVFLTKCIIAGGVRIENNCFVGTGSLIAEGRTIKARTFIVMGSSVITDTLEDSVFSGVPALLQKKKSYELRTDPYSINR